MLVLSSGFLRDTANDSKSLQSTTICNHSFMQRRCHFPSLARKGMSLRLVTLPALAPRLTDIRRLDREGLADLTKTATASAPSGESSVHENRNSNMESQASTITDLLQNRGISNSCKGCFLGESADLRLCGPTFSNLQGVARKIKSPAGLPCACLRQWQAAVNISQH